MNEIAAIERAQLFKDVDELKDIMKKMQEGCMMLTQMDGRLINNIDSNFKLIESVSERCDLLSERIDIVNKRIDMIVNELEIFQFNVNDRITRGPQL